MGFFDRLKQKITAPETPGAGAETLPAVTSAAALETTSAGALSTHKGGVAASLAELDAETRAEARERRRFLALVELTARGAVRMSTEGATAFVAAKHADEFPHLVEAGRGGASQLTYNNYRNWSARLNEARRTLGAAITEDDEVLYLAKRYAKGERGSTADARFLELFRKFYLNRNRLPVPAAYRLACDAWLKIDRATPVPTLGQIRLELTRIAPETIILAREGEVAWRNRCCDFITRDWSEIEPGELAVGDSRTFDTRVRVWDEVRGKWASVRPTIAALLDARSWTFAAYWITTDPVNADTLINTLALWCRNTGGVPPKMCYFDNGADYKARGFSTDFECDGTAHSIFRELGIRLVNATAYNARAKTVERAFRQMMENFDKLFPDYLGSNALQRSDASTYYDAHPEELPTVETFCKVFAAWLEKFHRTPIEGKIHAGQSPVQIWTGRTVDETRRKNADALAFALLKPEGARLVGRGPSVKFENEYYYSDAVKYGEKVLIKRSAFDPTFLMLFTPDGRLIGPARTREAVRAIADGKNEYERLTQLIARQSRQARTARTMLADLTGGVYGVSPLEILLTAGAETGVHDAARMTLVKGSCHDFHLRTNDALAALDAAAEKPAEKVRADEPAGEVKRIVRDDISDAELAEAQQIFKRRKTAVTEDAAGLEEIDRILKNKSQGENEDE